MIESISIKNFLSIRDEQTLSFVASNREKGKVDNFSPYWYNEIDENKKILKLLILVGENGAGKTNILQAVKYIQEIVKTRRDNRSDEIRYWPFLFDEDSKNQPSEMSIVYYINDECYQYSFKANDKTIFEEELKLVAGRKSARVYYRTSDEVSGLSEINFGTACDLNTSFQKNLQKDTICNQSVLATFWSLNMESDVLRKNYNFFENHLSRVHKSNESIADRLFFYKNNGDDRMRKLIQQLMHDIRSNIKDYKVVELAIDVLKDYPADIPDSFKEMLLNKYPGGIYKKRVLSFIHQTARGNFELSGGLESDGTIEIIKLMIVVYDIILGKKCSFIDEVERGIHSKALNFIMQMFLVLSKESQLIVATQDLQMMEMECLRRDSVRWIKKNSYGESVIDRINQNKVHKNKNLRNYLYAEMLSDMETIWDDSSLYETYSDILEANYSTLHGNTLDKIE